MYMYVYVPMWSDLVTFQTRLLILGEDKKTSTLVSVDGTLIIILLYDDIWIT
jgi:hypothetical protein